MRLSRLGGPQCFGLTRERGSDRHERLTACPEAWSPCRDQEAYGPWGALFRAERRRKTGIEGGRRERSANRKSANCGKSAYTTLLLRKNPSPHAAPGVRLGRPIRNSSCLIKLRTYEPNVHKISLSSSQSHARRRASDLFSPSPMHIITHASSLPLFLLFKGCSQKPGGPWILPNSVNKLGRRQIFLTRAIVRAATSPRPPRGQAGGVKRRVYRAF